MNIIETKIFISNDGALENMIMLQEKLTDILNQ